MATDEIEARVKAATGFELEELEERRKALEAANGGELYMKFPRRVVWVGEENMEVDGNGN